MFPKVLARVPLTILYSNPTFHLSVTTLRTGVRDLNTQRNHTEPRDGGFTFIFRSRGQVFSAVRSGPL